MPAPPQQRKPRRIQHTMDPSGRLVPIAAAILILAGGVRPSSGAATPAMLRSCSICLESPTFRALLWPGTATLLCKVRTAAITAFPLAHPTRLL
jgi:hypothetical protein